MIFFVEMNIKIICAMTRLGTLYLGEEFYYFISETCSLYWIIKLLLVFNVKCIVYYMNFVFYIYIYAITIKINTLIFLIFVI